MRDAQRTLIPATLVLLLITSSFVSLATPASAWAVPPGDGEPVSLTPADVRWHDLKSVNSLWFTRPANSSGTQNQPGLMVTERPDRVTFIPEAYLVCDVNCDVSTQGTTAQFQTREFKQGFTMRGANVLEANIFVEAPPQLRWTIQLWHDQKGTDTDMKVAELKDFVPDTTHDPRQGYRANISIQETIPWVDDTRLTVDKGDRLRVEVFAEKGEGFEPPVGGGTVDEGDIQESPDRATWILKREGGGDHNASYMDIIAQDAIRAAAWITDFDGQVTDVLLNHTDDEKDIIDAKFAVESAFGKDDLENVAPYFYLKRNSSGTSEEVELAPGVTQVEMREDAALAGDARRGWSLPETFWDYSHAKPGEYSAFFGAPPFRQGESGVVGGLGLQWDFILSDQGVDLSLFEGDTDSHQVLPNGSTTFLMELNNTGGNPDTFKLSLSSSALSQGWRAEIKGTNLLPGDRIRLETNESSLLRVTLHAPANAPLGQSRLFTFNASSSLDPTVYANLDLLATVDDERTNAVALIGGEEDVDTLVRPRGNATVTLYAWNKGTAPTDINVQMREGTEKSLWNTSLRLHGRSSDSFALSNVPPGDVQTLTVHFQTFGAESASEQTAFVNATYAGASADFEAPVREVTAAVELKESVRVEILNSILPGTYRFMEMECSDDSCPDDSGNPSGPLNVGSGSDDVDKDSNDGLAAGYFRVWVTNTGDRKADFFVEIPTSSLVERTLLDVEPYRCTKAFYDNEDFAQDDPNPNNPDEAKCDENADSTTIRPSLVLIDPETGDVVDTVNKIHDLRAGETAEVYVKVPHRNDAVYFAPSRFTFRVEARSDTGAFGSDSVKVVGDNGVEEQSGVLVEPVERSPQYFDLSDDKNKPFVNIDHAEKETVVRKVAVSDDGSRSHATYNVRVTNGASFANGGDHSSKLTVSLTGVKANDGWEAKLVPANQVVYNQNGTINGAQTPWKDTHAFTNCLDANQDGDCKDANDEYVGYLDKEYVVRVWLPKVTDEQKPLADQFNTVIFKANGTHLGSDEIQLETTILDMPRLRLEASSTEEFVQPGSTTAFLVNLNNSGGAPGTFHLQAQAPTGWNVDPTHRNYTISAYNEQPEALLVTAPDTAQPGQEVDIRVRATWEDPRDTKADDGKQDKVATFLNVTAKVAEAGDLLVSAANGNTANLAPGGQTQFSFDVTNNAAGASRDVRLEAVSSGDWTALLGKSSFEETTDNPDGDLDPGETQSTSLVVRAPNDVVEGTSHSFLVKAYEVGNPSNFAVETFTVSINEGEGRPVLAVDKEEQLVQRGSHTRFAVEVQNRGTAQDTFSLVLSEPSRSGWSARVEDANGVAIDELTLQPSTLTRVYVNVSAPFEEAEGTTVEPRLTVYNSNLKRQSQIAFTTVLQDYAVGLDVASERLDLVPGVNKRVEISLTNRGNGNDTLNMSMDLQGLEGIWSATFNRDTFFLEPGETETAIATLHSPRSPLPTPRTLTFRVWAGTERGATVNEWDNRTQALVVNVLPYRGQDVDDDGFLELAVDHNKDRRDGYEHYREVFPEGRNSTYLQSLDGDEDRSVDHLLDDPGNAGLDGVADVYWDPDDVVVYRIRWTPDIDEDGTPDYLLDTDGDDIVDAFWNPVLQILGDAEARRIVGEDQRQFLLDTDGNGALDTYYDPVSGTITDILPAPGQGEDALGIDTDDNGRADKYYNTRTEEVSDAQVANLSRFAQQYWYLFALLAAVVVVFGVVLYRRQEEDQPREGPKDE